MPFVEILDHAGYSTTYPHRELILCRCSCGTEFINRADHIWGGNTKSCGCWASAKPKKTFYKHGHGVHGKWTPTYFSWVSLRNRCKNANCAGYEYYGGRGISVCSRWDSFENFLADMGERPDGKSIDRIDPDGNYEPNNCRWATRSEQSKNQRRHKCVHSH